MTLFLTSLRDENIQHMLLDFDVDHILTANTIDDGHCFSDEPELGIVICMYFINFC